MPNVVTYRRAGASNGRFSLDAQATRLTIEAAAQQLVIVEDYFDSASGLLPLEEREGMAVMLDALAAGQAQGVLVTSIDRISRSLTDCFSFARLLREMECRLFVADQGEVDVKRYLSEGPTWIHSRDLAGLLTGGD